MRQIGDAHAFADAQAAVIWRLRPAQYIEQGGFALTVATQQGDALAAFQREVDVVKQGPPAEGKREVLSSEEEGHGESLFIFGEFVQEASCDLVVLCGSLFQP